MHHYSYPSRLRLFLLCAILSLSCQAQPGNKKIVNKGEEGFSQSVRFYPNDNNVPKSAVVLEDGYIIAGQKFTKQGSNMQPSALLKISKEGKLLRQEMLGNDGGMEKSARLESLFQLGSNRIIQAGHKRARLWIREINNNLDVVRDTTFSSIPMNWIYPPRIFPAQGGFYVIGNPLGLTFVAQDFSKTAYHPIQPDTGSFTDYTLNDAAYHPGKGLFYIVGGGCILYKNSNCQQYQQQLLVYDTKTHKIIQQWPLPQFKTVRSIRLQGEQLYLVGENMKKLNSDSLKQFYIFNNFDIVVSTYNLQGKKLGEFTYNETEHEFVNDMMLVDGKIHLGGELFDKASITFKSTYLVFDMTGRLLEKRIFGQDLSENKLFKIYPMKEGKKLLLCRDRGWRIIVTD